MGVVDMWRLSIREVYVYADVCKYIDIHLYMHVNICLCIGMYMHMYLFMCLCLYV